MPCNSDYMNPAEIRRVAFNKLSNEERKALGIKL